ncbi:DUF4981 domain-containing protein [bacterium D16-51]|nr:DUF4981 domain-containing protein [bacterium D16-59]RKI60500.1 DUF4981 domain-containing protein [bacterium D16-51]
MIVPKYFEDLGVLHKNVMPNRAYYIPASGKLAGNERDRETSDRFLLLSGQWKFRYFDSIYDAQEEFYKEGFSVEGFDTVTVPGVWQNYGYGNNQYTNSRYPFPVDPPYVPHENPCGEYLHTFEYHKKAEAPKAFLNFEGVDSCFYVWVNGIFVGYSQVSHSTSEFDVTESLRDGENTLAVLVLKWCDGSYLEDQDKFRMSGIFRDVYLLERTKEGVSDYFVKTWLSGDYKDANMEIIFQYRNQPVPVTVQILDKDGEEIADGQTEDGRLFFGIRDAVLWNAEEPYLYTIVISTENEVITDKIGFRDISVRDGILYVNGKTVKFHGTNRHDSDPVTGFSISCQQIKKDLVLMKEHNINAIRTSHYPNAPYFYQLYDRLGFYVIDEADNESHGTAEIYRKKPDEGLKHWNELIADNAAFIDATVDRVQRCVERDKNRPCVLIWSMGNECAYGCTFEEALKWTKEFDPGRLTHYESARYRSAQKKYDYSNLDMYSRMYPSIDEIHDYFKKDGTKPFVLCEYCHAMGNGPGDLEDYFQAIHQYDGACGGFVWEWSDHAVDLGKTEKGIKKYAYGGFHKEYPHDANFCMDGLVYPDRTPHTGLLEFKNVHRPARITSFCQKKKELVIRNYMDFVNLKDYLTAHYELLCDGVVVEKGKLEELDILPHEEKAVSIAFHVPEKGKCFLKVKYLQKSATEALPAGLELGFDEVMVETEENENQKVKELLAKENPGTQFYLDEDDCRLTISTEKFCYVYHKLTGVFTSLTFQNQAFLGRPMEYNIWRAPTDNDSGIKAEWQRAQYDQAAARSYGTKTEVLENRVVIETELSVSAVFIQRILDIRACWTVWANGFIEVAFSVKKNEEFPFLPRFGLRMFLPKSMEKVTYCGIGPAESYVDKRQAGYHGLFCTDVRSLHEDYLRPQENGSHYGCDYVTAENKMAALTIAGMETFSFNASFYTQEELSEKAYNYQLEESSYTVLCADYRQSGIGSNSCGPQLAEKYQLNENEFCFRIWIIPEGKQGF